MSSIQEGTKIFSGYTKYFCTVFEMIFNGIFASSVIMDAALYASLSTVFEDLQDPNVVVGYIQTVKIVEGFIQDLGIQKWVVQSDNNLDVGGFRIEAIVSMVAKSTGECSADHIKIETHLKKTIENVRSHRIEMIINVYLFPKQGLYQRVIIEY